MASFSRSAANALGAGYDFASAKTDSSGKTAYQRYIEKYYGPGVESHNDPLAIARAATGAVAEGLKSGAGFLSHAAAGLLGMPRGDSGASSQQQAVPAHSDLYGGRGGGGAAGRMPSGNISSPGAGLSSSGPVSEAQERFFNAISQAEGTTKYGYNTVYGGANGIGGRPLTSMTLREVTDYQKGMIARTNHSPMGRFQMVRGSVLDHATELGLDLDKTMFDQRTQNMLALQEAKTKGVKPTIWAGFVGKPQLLATAQQAYSQIKGKPVSALAYTSTDQAQTPAQQAAAAEAAGRASGSSTISRRGSDVAAMQRDLNSRGAKLTVDGLEGPLTRAAQQQFYGSPTSVRTPSFTYAPPTPTTANNWSSLQGSPTRTVNQRQDYVSSGSRTYTPPQQSYTSGRGDEGRGVNAPLSAQPRRVPTESISGPPMPLRELHKPPQAPQTPYMNQPYTGPEWDVIPGPVQVPVPQTPSFMNPYTASTGGANAITARVPQARPPQPGDTPTPYLNQPYTMPAWGVQAPTARIPQARPNYQPPEQAVPTLIERLDNLVQRAERALGGNRGSDSRSSGSRSGGGGAGSPNSGLGYSGGRGYGGGSIGRGTGGAINPNR